MLIIGVCGYMGCGKDAFFELCMNHLRSKGFLVAQLNFADALKDKAREFGWDGNKDVKGRRFLQILGTDIGRAYDPDFWVKQWKDTLSRYQRSIHLDFIFTTDVRFPNEVEAIQENGVLVRVDRKEGQEDVVAHVSENPNLLRTNYTIENPGTTLEEYNKLAIQFCDDVLLELWSKEVPF